MSLTVAAANLLLDAANSVADLNSIIEQLDVYATGTKTLLYSAGVGDLWTGKVASVEFGVRS